MAQSSSKNTPSVQARRYEILKAVFDDEGASYDSLTTKVQILMALQGGALVATRDGSSLSHILLGLGLVAGLVCLGAGYWYNPLLPAGAKLTHRTEDALMGTVNDLVAKSTERNIRLNDWRWWIWLGSNALTIAAVLVALLP